MWPEHEAYICYSYNQGNANGDKKNNRNHTANLRQKLWARNYVKYFTIFILNNAVGFY